MNPKRLIVFIQVRIFIGIHRESKSWEMEKMDRKSERETKGAIYSGN